MLNQTIFEKICFIESKKEMQNIEEISIQFQVSYSL